MLRGCTTADENNPDPSEQPTLHGRDARATKAHFQERHRVTEGWVYMFSPRLCGYVAKLRGPDSVIIVKRSAAPWSRGITKVRIFWYQP